MGVGVMETRVTLVVIFVLALLACNKGGGGGGEPAWATFSVTSATDLPICSGGIVGRLYYIEADNTFQVCKSSGWLTLNIKGSDGLTVVNKVQCSKSPSSVPSGLRFIYSITTFSTGDVLAQCTVYEASRSYSSSAFHLSSQASGASCSVYYDIENPLDFGKWNFAKSGGTTSVIYDDPPASFDGFLVTFDTGDCVTTTP